VDPEFPKRAAANRDRQIHNVIVAGESYGQGSSREHAALCPMFLGVKAVVAKSVERIHLANLINFGIVPLTFEAASDYETLGLGDRLVIEGLRDALQAGQTRVEMKNVTRGLSVFLTLRVSERERDMLLCGGLLNLTHGRS
jgi:aconitate hydratase